MEKKSFFTDIFFAKNFFSQDTDKCKNNLAIDNVIKFSFKIDRSKDSELYSD